jgi:nucleoside-diphosphate-sugar epimerase
MGELAMSTNDQLYGLPTLSLRFFMVFGPRNPSEGAYAIVTGKFMGRLKAGLPLIIEGSGANFRDFIHVDDIARALILGYQSDVHGTVINAGTGITHSVKEVADLVSSNQQHVAARKNDLLGTMADTCRAKELLHFQTRHEFIASMRQLIADAKTGEEYLPAMWASLADDLEAQFHGWKKRSIQEQSQIIKDALQNSQTFLDDLLRRTAHDLK